MMRMLKGIRVLSLSVFISSFIFCAEPQHSKRPIFFCSTVLHYYGGENLELLNNNQSYDAYSFIQYISDFGIHFLQYLPTAEPRTLTLDTVFRIKGDLGNAGRYTCFPLPPLKIGWGKSETIPFITNKKFIWWLREGAITYAPTKQDQTTFFKVGLFPYKLGIGLSLGNAYNISIPILGQFIYEQIDQFRPGLLGKISSFNEQYSGSVYLGIIETKSNSFANTALLTNTQNLKTPLEQTGSGKGNILFCMELTYSPSFTDTCCLINPYFLVQKDSYQTIEFPGDASNTLITPGLFFSYERRNTTVTFECSKNFGHQCVKAWDRNQLIHTNNLFNTQLFYAPDQTLTLETVTNDDFIPSPLVIQPNYLTQNYGNGTNFLYSTSPGTTFIFKNSYDRLRNSYKNTYKGFMIYADILFSEKHFTWGIAGCCTSGAPNPNDTFDTITMTRLTPGIPYKDYNKNYKGFVGVNQLFEGKAVTPLYFGQAQRLNEPLSETQQLTTALYTNQSFIGTTLKGFTHIKNGIFSIAGTVATYFQTAAVTKGLSATLWQAQSLDFTPQMHTDMNLILPNHLGTECNWNITYEIQEYLQFSLLGAVFAPGAYYKKASGKYIPLAAQQQLSAVNFESDQKTSTPQLGNSISYFVCINLTCLFDFSTSLFSKNIC